MENDLKILVDYSVKKIKLKDMFYEDDKTHYSEKVSYLLTKLCQRYNDNS